MHPVEKYLNNLKEIHSTRGGTKEESFYGAFELFINEIGNKLSPLVRCISQLKNVGAGEPDFGLYTGNQFQKNNESDPIDGQLPERGVIECKPWNDDSFAQSDSAQISKYWNRYGLVLVTNFHDFVLVGRSDKGRPIRLGTYRMANTIDNFHDLLNNPHQAAISQGNQLIEFLEHVMLQNVPITNPQDLAWFFAAYAREARHRVENVASLPALNGLKIALEDSLGIKFDGDKGEHFFQATLVQTLFYGIFSSWVLWLQDENGKEGEKFDWHNAAWSLHVPMIKSLFEQIAMPSKLKPLGVAEVLDWSEMALNRVDRTAFFQQFEEDNAVQYFYEPFLKAYDPDLRKELGVWFTPPEIVQYQVDRIDDVLRHELNIADGLANKNVVILDPCCGTGAYLIATLKCINKTLEAKGKNALTAQKIKKAVIERIFGFEILPAPFVVAHLQIGLMLKRIGASLDGEINERAGVYLTNALTGWQPPEEPKSKIPLFPELVEERDAANKVKRETPIIVILGNPPYNGFAGVSPDEEGDLVKIYKKNLGTPVEKGGWGIKKSSLDDLYVRFFRIAERRIAETGKGVISYITNFSYLEEPSYVVMRQHILGEFDRVWIDCMNGSSRRTGKTTLEGAADPSVFSTEYNKEGIKVGTAICLMVRKEKREKKSVVFYRDFWGINKKQDLIKSLSSKNFDKKYKRAMPKDVNRYSLLPLKVSKYYFSWPSILDFAAEQPYNGPIERRGNSLIVFKDEASRLNLLNKYLDPSIPDDQMAHLVPKWMKSSGEFDAEATRNVLKGEVKFSKKNIVKYLFKPFDVRVAYLDEKIAPLFSRPAPKLLNQFKIEDNAFFITRDAADKSPEGPPFIFSKIIYDYDGISGHARHFPIFITKETMHHKDKRTVDMFGVCSAKKANLSEFAKNYLTQFGFLNIDGDYTTASLIWLHVLAIGFSPEYLKDNKDGFRQNWPRFPLPKRKENLLKSARLGERVALLLTPDKDPVDFMPPQIIENLKSIAVISKVNGGQLNPRAGDLDLTVNWGYEGSDGVCMPGSGKCEQREQKDKKLKKLLGDKTVDVYLNNGAFWSNIPLSVWEYHIGGYQIIKKWLSYRDKNLIKRGLHSEEVEHITLVAKQIACLLLSYPELDKNYTRIISDSLSETKCNPN